MLSQLADTSSHGPDGPTTWGYLWFLFPVGLLVLALIGSRRMRRKYGGPPRFAGPPLAGIARIQFVGPVYRLAAPLRGIRLSVEIPGHAPYDATATQAIPAPAYHLIKKGRTVAVQVDSTNLKYVRIDFDDPITGSSGSG